MSTTILSSTNSRRGGSSKGRLQAEARRIMVQRSQGQHMPEEQDRRSFAPPSVLYCPKLADLQGPWNEDVTEAISKRQKSTRGEVFSHPWEYTVFYKAGAA